MTFCIFTFNKRCHQAAFVKKTRELFEVKEKARDDVEDVDQRHGQQESPSLCVLVRVVDVSQERRPEDAEGEEEAECEAEEERGEDGERDQHRVPGHTHVFTSLRGSSRYHCVSSKQNVVEVIVWLTHQMSGTLV